MSETARKISEMAEYLPEIEQRLVLQLIERLIPDDMATPDDIAAIEDARREYERGETIPIDSIDWDNLDKLSLD